VPAEKPGREEPAAERRTFSARLLPYADIILKLTPVIFTAVGGWLAATYQSHSSGITLLNQREQAETQLRATMFSNLIGPIVGSRGNSQLAPEDERLLVEMITLNFHEHVELKPLLLHADGRLAEKMQGHSTPSAEREALAQMRRSLRSVVRRVLDRQLSVLQKECDRGLSRLCSESSLADRNACAQPSPEAIPVRGNPQCIAFTSEDVSNTERTHVVAAPDGKYELRVSLGNVDWRKRLVEVYIPVTHSAGGTTQSLGTLDFGLTPYDLPFTDNTFLDRDHRFAVVVKDMVTEDDLPQGVKPPPGWINRVNLWILWFPEGYVLPHERPVNFHEIRKVLKLD